MKTRSDMAADRDAALLAELRAAGYVIDTDEIHMRPTPVRFGPRVVALIERRWHNQGWDLRCPQFIRRGYRASLRRTEPDNPRNWGSRPFKKPASILAALAEAFSCLPTAAEIERAALNAKLDRLCVRLADAHKLYTRVDVELLDYLLAIARESTLNDDPRMLIQVGALRTAQADYRELARQADALRDQIGEKD